MSTTVFLSYTKADASSADELMIWHGRGELGRILVGYEPPDFRPVEESEAAPNPLSAQLTASATDTVLVIVGNKTSRFDWIAAEIQNAVGRHLNLYVTRVPGTAGDLPRPFNEDDVIPWDGARLKAALGG